MQKYIHMFIDTRQNLDILKTIQCNKSQRIWTENAHDMLKLYYDNNRLAYNESKSKNKEFKNIFFS